MMGADEHAKVCAERALFIQFLPPYCCLGPGYTAGRSVRWEAACCAKPWTSFVRSSACGQQQQHSPAGEKLVLWDCRGARSRTPPTPRVHVRLPPLALSRRPTLRMQAAS
eukprot:366088-Chlamydomonas_euryale.AAC.9